MPIIFPEHFTFVHKWSRSVYLGINKDHILFTIEPPGWTTPTTLHHGPDKDGPVLATVGMEKGSKGQRSRISVPSRGNYQDTAEVTLTRNYLRVHGFAVQTGRNGYPERFEWRPSRGDEVRELSGSSYTTGWKLVRLDGPNTGFGGSRGSRADGFTSDGKEVVAVAAHTTKNRTGPDACFTGAGRTGELGEMFEIIAVTSLIRIVELEKQSNAGTATATTSAIS